MTGRIERRLAELGLTLPAPAAPAASYLPWVRQGGLVYVSGQVSRSADGQPITGRLGEGMGIEAGQAAARTCAIGLLSVLKDACGGDLDLVVRAVKLTGFVHSTPDFTDHHKVMNGASDLLAEVLGEAGRHARSAVGSVALPLGVAVEVEGIFELA